MGRVLSRVKAWLLGLRAVDGLRYRLKPEMGTEEVAESSS